jgi:surface antigen
MATFDEFRINHPIGSRVADTSLIGHGETAETCYQCVSLVKQYLRECYGLEPGAWGDAIHYWTQTNQTLLTKFYQVSNTEAQKGDIAILWGLAGNTYGHIGIATGGLTATQVEILEQNGSTGGGTGTGGDAIRTRHVDRSRVAGLLRPASIPAATPPITLNVQPFPARERYKVKPGMQKWDLDQPNFQAIKDNPIGHAGDDTYIWVTDWLTRSDLPQYTYYLEDGSKHQGWNRNDLELSPLPYIPPSPPISAVPVEFYTLITNVMRFSSTTDALHHQNYQGDLTEGQYIVIAKQEKAYNLSDDNMKDRGWWVNIDDNKIPDPTPPAPQQDTDIVYPEVEPVDFPVQVEQPKIVSHSLRADGAVVMYQATNSQPIEIKDYQTGKEPITMQPYNYSSETGKNAPVPLVSTFTVNGTEYGRTQKVAKAGWFYGVPMSALELYELPEATVAVHTQPPVPRVSSFDTNKDGDVNLKDFTEGIQDFIDFTGKWFKDSVTPIIPKVAQAKQKISKSVDGFSKRSK